MFWEVIQYISLKSAETFDTILDSVILIYLRIQVPIFKLCSVTGNFFDVILVLIVNIFKTLSAKYCKRFDFHNCFVMFIQQR